MGLQRPLAASGIKAARRQRRQGSAERFEKRRQILLHQQRIGQQQFLGRKPCHLGGDLFPGQGRNRKLARGHIGGGDREVRTAASQRRQKVRGPRLQQR